MAQWHSHWDCKAILILSPSTSLTTTYQISNLHKLSRKQGWQFIKTGQFIKISWIFPPLHVVSGADRLHNDSPYLRTRTNKTMIYWFKFFKFFLFEIILFVTDVGTDLFSAVDYGLKNDWYWAIATGVCILLPSIPKFLSFFEKKAKKYRRDAGSQIFCFFKLLFWILSFPFFLSNNTNIRLLKSFANHSEMKMSWMER